MTIALTTPESRPSSTQARLVDAKINVLDKIATFEFVVGRVQDGGFVVDRRVTRQFVDDDNRSDFTTLMNAVTEIRQMRRAVELYIVSLGDFAGTVS